MTTSSPGESSAPKAEAKAPVAPAVTSTAPGSTARPFFCRSFSTKASMSAGSPWGET